MSIDTSKTILLEKKYLYVRASLGFKLEGTSTEIIPTNNGFYRFYIDNLSKALGNSYVNILYDSKDLAFQSFCSDLYMDELMSSDSSAIEDVVLELKKNTSKIEEFENGVSSGMASNHEDNVAIVEKINEFEHGVSAGMASNHEDNVALNTSLKSFFTNLNKTCSFSPLFSFDVPSEQYPFSLLSVDDFLTNGYSFYCSKFVNYASIGSPSNYTPFNVVFDIPSFDSFPSLKIDVFACFSYFSSSDNFLSQKIYSNTAISFSRIISRSVNLRTSDVRNMSVLVNVPLDVFKFLVFFGHSTKYSRCSYYDKTLTIYPVDGFSCINQDFNFDFDGGYLTLNIYGDIDPSYLNSRTLRFFTDIGYYDFACSDLNFHKVSSGFNGLLLPSNFPQIGSSGSIKKLFGISCF